MLAIAACALVLATPLQALAVEDNADAKFASFITGTVVGEFTRAPLAGAEVAAYAPDKKTGDWVAEATATADASGAYSMKVRAKSYIIGFAATDQVAEYFDNADALSVAAPIAVLEGQTVVANASLRPFEDGTEAHPYLVYDIATLDAVRRNANAHYRQVADVDAGATRVPGSPYFNDGAGWLPIENLFGSYDGGGFEIRGLYINRPLDPVVGLFAYANAPLRAIDVVDCDITALQSVGAVAGVTWRDVTRCSSSGSVRAVRDLEGFAGAHTAGGLFGLSLGTMTYCTSSARVDAQLGECGGLAGYSGAVSKSSFTGQINPEFVLFGIGSGFRYGGIAGRATGGISDCYVNGLVRGAYRVAGIVGQTSSDVANCYASGTLWSDGSAGAIVCDFRGTSVTSCYYDSARLGGYGSDHPLGNRVTTEAMWDPATFVGWDFDNTWIAPSAGVYPTLR